MKYTIIKKDKFSNAKRGILSLEHGDIQTPAFMPVGTNATVKAISHQDVKDMGYKIILANTYHLYLRPGLEVLKKMQGIRKFSNWDYNILTDSGGFQVFSLSKLNKIREEGVRFASHIDGSYHLFTPESVVDIQQVFKSDISMLLDVCSAYGVSYEQARKDLNITHLWAKRALDRKKELGESFIGNQFGIMQGNFYEDLRKESADFFNNLDFPGLAIGGLSVGEEKNKYHDYLALSAQYLRDDKPRYVMGIGTPDYILSAVEQGIDLFDCVFATRNARNASLFTDDGMISVKKATYAFDDRPIMEGCTCQACKGYSRAYLRHLFKAKEIYAAMLATTHNLHYLADFMRRIHKAIDEDRFLSFKKEYLERYFRNQQP